MFASRVKKKNIFDCSPVDSLDENFEDLLNMASFKLERIVSRGHNTPPGVWLDEDWAEWVVLLKGSSGLSIEGEEEIIVLKPGDYLYLPAHLRHRVEWTHAEGETIWIALHHQN